MSDAGSQCASPRRAPPAVQSPSWVSAHVRRSSPDRGLSSCTAPAAAISGVRGMGGIRKSELAYGVAGRVKDIFADAQIVVELHGVAHDC
jgi:hypothetical protein